MMSATLLMLIVVAIMVISETSIQDLIGGVILHPVQVQNARREAGRIDQTGCWFVAIG